MGYNVVTEQVDFTIPAARIEGALLAVNGNRSIPPADDGHASALIEAIADNGFDVVDCPDGAIAIVGYCGKSADQDDLVARLAPHAAEGSFIEWRGEDDARWRHFVCDGRVQIQYPIVSWVPELADSACDECGSRIPGHMESLINSHHGANCSLHATATAMR